MARFTNQSRKPNLGGFQRAKNAGWGVASDMAKTSRKGIRGLFSFMSKNWYKLFIILVLWFFFGSRARRKKFFPELLESVGIDADDNVEAGFGSSEVQYDDDVAGNPDGAGKNTLPMIKKLNDQIFTYLSGTNLLMYPEIVNRLANLSKYELKVAVWDWRQRKMAQAGSNLYNFIWWELSSRSWYSPALNYLESEGYKNV